MSSPSQRLLLSAAAAIALGYLITMVVTGALPENRQIAEFQAEGLLEQAPESITRVAVAVKDASHVFVRRGSDWITESGAGPVSAEIATALDRALKIMHNAKPVRVLTGDDLTGASPAEFGFDQPRVAVTLGNANGTVLAAQFGASNTDGILQFMRVKGKDQVYLMSDFVGQGWEKLAMAAKAQ